MRSVGFTTLCAFMLWSSLCLGASTASRDAAHAISPRAYPLVCASRNGRILGVAGTAFFVDSRGTFVTARHVLEGVEAARSYYGCTPAVYVTLTKWYPFERCRSDRVADIASCRTKGGFSAVRLHALPEPLRTTATYAGFPHNRLTPEFHRGVVERFGTATSDAMLLIYAPARPGASGSPVYTSAGDVIGMVVIAGHLDGRDVCLAESAGRISAFLASESHNL